MADLIQWGRTAQRTGLLKVNDGRGKEMTIVFRDGWIVFSSSNDKRERFRAYLEYLGLCSREDLDRAFAVHEATGSALAAILVDERKLLRDQAIGVLREKTIEDVCDVFLWPDGSFEFEPRTTINSVELPIRLDPVNIVWEGLRRSDIWNRMNSYIHATSLYDRNNDVDGEEGGHWDDARVAKHVFAKLDGNTPVSGVVERLPFSRFKIYRAISELLSNRFIRPSDATDAIDRDQMVRRKIEEARSAAGDRRFMEALAMLQGLAAANPGRNEIVQELVAVTQAFERSVYQHNFGKDDVPVVAIGADALQRLTLDPGEGFVLSRIDGRLPLREILKITPMPEVESLRAVKRLLAAKVIDFPYRYPGPQEMKRT